MADAVKHFLDKLSGREKTEKEKKVEILKEVVARNKIKNSSDYTIDDVVASSEAWKVKHDLYI